MLYITVNLMLIFYSNYGPYCWYSLPSCRLAQLSLGFSVMAPFLCFMTQCLLLATLSLIFFQVARNVLEPL